jgi:hypothetical protein
MHVAMISWKSHFPISQHLLLSPPQLRERERERERDIERDVRDKKRKKGNLDEREDRSQR